MMHFVRLNKNSLTHIRTFEAMVSARDSCKRASVTLMKTLALLYGCSDPPEVIEMCVAESSWLGGGICNVGLALP